MSRLCSGSSGPEVVNLQQLLNKKGASPELTANGRFDSKTRAAVVDFQEAEWLLPDGHCRNLHLECPAGHREI